MDLVEDGCRERVGDSENPRYEEMRRVFIMKLKGANRKSKSQTVARGIGREFRTGLGARKRL